jgi:hypothetical protein
MGLKKCEKCGEEVDEAKAFCPDCGSPFVEEKKRDSSSEFDKYAGTVNFSKSVYKMMLSEMELDTSKKPDKKNTPNLEKDPKDSKPPEVNTPKSISPEVSKPKSIPPETVSSINNSPEIKPPNQIKKSEKNKWIIVGGVGLLFLIFLAGAFLLVLLYSYYS